MQQKGEGKSTSSRIRGLGGDERRGEKRRSWQLRGFRLYLVTASARMLQIGKRARLKPTTTITTCFCSNRPVHLSSPFASSSSSSSSPPTPPTPTESLATRLQKRRPAPAPPTEQLSPCSADAAAPESSRAFSRPPLSIANTTSRLNQLVQSLTEPPAPPHPSTSSHGQRQTQKQPSELQLGGEAPKGKSKATKPAWNPSGSRMKRKVARRQVRSLLSLPALAPKADLPRLSITSHRPLKRGTLPHQAATVIFTPPMLLPRRLFPLSRPAEPSPNFG